MSRYDGPCKRCGSKKDLSHKLPMRVNELGFCMDSAYLCDECEDSLLGNEQHKTVNRLEFIKDQIEETINGMLKYHGMA